jgi:hypothetical protein
MDSVKFLKEIFKKESVIIALQKYLKEYWVTISEDKKCYIVNFKKKFKNTPNIDKKVFENEIIESEFLFFKSQETINLREYILKTVLSPNKRKRNG